MWSFRYSIFHMINNWLYVSFHHQTFIIIIVQHNRSLNWKCNKPERNHNYSPSKCNELLQPLPIFLKKHTKWPHFSSNVQVIFWNLNFVHSLFHETTSTYFLNSKIVNHPLSVSFRTFEFLMTQIFTYR